MMHLVKVLLVMVITLLLTLSGNAQETSSAVTEHIHKQIKNLRTAHLNSNVELADQLYHPNLILTSQSGKKYNKEVALVNIKNTFEAYESSEIEFLTVCEDVVLTNYINERKYKDFPKGRYRLTVVWTIHNNTWKIISMQSSKVKTRKQKE